ncbi:hypothetical protein E2C01_015437 [Portunus trituberculatus]|uniref:Uncharacterized protein n=1 Tax=Portunus trituberculatus TaxID=210409 RepID=A0A5B7DN00_PORTR|nr:hypothetical protein [Portunus trituberculatus]
MEALTQATPLICVATEQQQQTAGGFHKNHDKSSGMFNTRRSRKKRGTRMQLTFLSRHFFYKLVKNIRLYKEVH